MTKFPPISSAKAAIHTWPGTRIGASGAGEGNQIGVGIKIGVNS